MWLLRPYIIVAAATMATIAVVAAATMATIATMAIVTIATTATIVAIAVVIDWTNGSRSATRLGMR